MSKKNERMARLFGAISEENGGDPVGFTPRAIWMSARELGAGQISVWMHTENGANTEVSLSPSAVMAAFDQHDDDARDVYKVYVSGEGGNGPHMELVGFGGFDGRHYTWEDVLRAGKPQAEAPDSIMIDGREYTLHSRHSDVDRARSQVDGLREEGKNAQIRKKAGMHVVYTRDRAPKKEKPAKKAPAKKAPAKKAKKPQPKAKKPSSRKKAGGKGKA